MPLAKLTLLLHTALGATRYQRAKRLHTLVRTGAVQLAGNRRLKIYGTLTCNSGRRMLPGSRVFFQDAAAAVAAGYRPCGHCMRADYRRWRVESEISSRAR